MNWILEGCLFCERGHYQDAIAAFDQAISINPNDAKAWNHRGNALSALGRCCEALVAYDRAVSLRSDYHQAWFNRGLLLVEMMAYGNAIESYDRAIDLEPDPIYLHARQNIWLKNKLVPLNV